ncbi:hypothetical protein GCM10007989_07150 [Devosia pacifica]|uniref:BioF2-like acetyltransferase domain-containing protein n=1 Tax=Devosia pacifica TaxID=1335967 RepID=A0A918VQI4_9HYPH|nr:GNAT family N-acetyltransferase [Devosia pacifica]GHA14984.1 hypothetical protein GCM10007989_07150 [Devosia pacifica]
MSVSTEAAPSLAPSAAYSRAAGAVRLTHELVTGEAWDEIIAGFDEACQEQMHVFAQSRWPGVVQEPVVFRRNGEVVGGTMVMVQRLPLGVGAIAITKWGPMLRDTAAPDADELHDAMIECLIGEYAERRRMMLSVLPRAALFSPNRRYDALIRRGFRPGSELLFPDRYIVNLRLDDDGLRKSFHQKWRYHLNKSLKQGLDFEHATAERMEDFHMLYNAMTDRKQFPDHSAYGTVDELMTMDPEALRPELFFVRKDEALVAGAIIFKAGDRAVYLYGATSDQALPLRAGYFLHWHIIRWLRDNTCADWYDLGGTDGFQGLHQFKKGMVGTAGVIQPVPPVANYAASRFAYLTGLGAFAARDAFHQVRRHVDGWRNPKARPDQERRAGDTE